MDDVLEQKKLLALQQIKNDTPMILSQLKKMIGCPYGFEKILRIDVISLVWEYSATHCLSFFGEVRDTVYLNPDMKIIDKIIFFFKREGDYKKSVGVMLKDYRLVLYL
ncbi:MAG: hypothetical protein WC410_01485 [Candidatus Paceibacterota bacterium]|jgi:hypothetical protein|nr:hypothetical protein [Candidatus Paceibacterota bacterium]MDD5555527.1 hypothetical protein [Candidatus Paceibacterota bacterium]